MNFKGVQTSWEKSGTFTKNLSQLALQKSKFCWAHLHARSWSSKTSVKVNLLENKEFEFEIQTTHNYNTNQIKLGFHSSFYST
jgi:hypothetical protein